MKKKQYTTFKHQKTRETKNTTQISVLGCADFWSGMLQVSWMRFW
jgi:hypothetical protein